MLDKEFEELKVRMAAIPPSRQFKFYKTLKGYDFLWNGEQIDVHELFYYKGIKDPYAVLNGVYSEIQIIK